MTLEETHLPQSIGAGENNDDDDDDEDDDGDGEDMEAFEVSGMLDEQDKVLFIRYALQKYRL